MGNSKLIISNDNRRFVQALAALDDVIGEFRAARGLADRSPADSGARPQSPAKEKISNQPDL